ncbi:hypothetical protein BJX64DRAFT_287475 [Aspergillus heterothallicus]
MPSAIINIFTATLILLGTIATATILIVVTGLLSLIISVFIIFTDLSTMRWKFWKQVPKAAMVLFAVAIVASIAAIASSEIVRHKNSAISSSSSNSTAGNANVSCPSQDCASVHVRKRYRGDLNHVDAEDSGHPNGNIQRNPDTRS